MNKSATERIKEDYKLSDTESRVMAAIGNEYVNGLNRPLKPPSLSIITGLPEQECEQALYKLMEVGLVDHIEF